MRKLLNLYWLTLMVICLVACSDGGDEPGSPDAPKPDNKAELTIPSTENLSPVFDATGGTATISFTASANWTASMTNARADGWVSVSPASGGKGNAVITITATANDTPDERNAAIQLKCGNTTKNIYIVQKQKDALTATTTKYEVGKEGGEIEVEVKANVDFSIVIPETSKEWIKEAKSKSRALVSSQLTFSIEPNWEQEKREGEIIIQSGDLKETIHVYQAAGGKMILLTKNEYRVSTQGEIIQVEVMSNCDYEMQMPDVDWMRETTQNRAVSTHTLYFEIDENESYDNRVAEVIFKDKESSLSETLRIVQAQVGAIVLSQKEYKLSAADALLEVEFNTNVDYKIVIPAAYKWITQVENDARGLTPHKAYFKIALNESKTPRTGSISITDSNSDLTEKIVVEQEGFNFYLRCPNNQNGGHYVCDSKGGTMAHFIESDGPYTFEILTNSKEEWVRYLRKEQVGENQYHEVYQIDENDTGVERQCTIRVSLGNIKLEFYLAQAEKRILTFSQTELNVSSEGGKLPLVIKTEGSWADNANEFWLYSIPRDATSWLSIERNTKPGSKEDTATIVVQPNLTSKQRSASILFYVFAGEEYYIQVNQTAQGTIVLSQDNYILSNQKHSLNVDLATSDYTVEIDSEASSWITLGQKGGEGENTKQELLITENPTNDERKGKVTFTSGSSKNQITITQLMPPPALVDDTPEKWHDFPLPEVELIMTNPKSEGSQIYSAIVPDCEALIAIASHKVLDCLYNEPDNELIPRQKKLEYVLEDYDGVSYNAGGGLKIGLSNQYLADYYHRHGAEAMIKENIGVLTHELTHSYQASPKNCGGYQPGTHYFAFIEGVADAVRVLCGGFPNESDRPKGGHYMDAYRHGGFFIAWLVNNKDANFLRKFNESAHKLETWTFEAGVKYALGEDADAEALWKEYQKAMGDI